MTRIVFDKYAPDASSGSWIYSTLPYPEAIIKKTYAAVETFSTEVNKMSVKVNKSQEDKMNTRRLVEVIVIDPDSRVPDDKALLLHTHPFLTDASDKAIFYEHGLAELLKEHNKVREGLDLPPVTLDDIVFKVNTLNTTYLTHTD